MIFLWSVLGLLVLVVAFGIFGALAGDDDKAASGAAPAYRIVSDQDRKVVVEVDKAESLRAVFDDVRSKYKGEGGYFVSLNCSSGGTAAADNRLANGKFANGALGAAQTGLKAGGVEFALVDGATCP